MFGINDIIKFYYLETYTDNFIVVDWKINEQTKELLEEIAKETELLAEDKKYAFNVEQYFVEHNLPKFIPVGLNGRVMVKVSGKVQKGDHISTSHIPGVGIVGDMNIVGIAVQNKEDEQVGLVKVLLKV